jgi:hypothetical protein
MSRTDLLHWRTAFDGLPRCIHHKIAAHLIARALASPPRAGAIRVSYRYL